MDKRSSFFTQLIETGQFLIDEKGHAILLGEYLLLIPPSVILKLQGILEKELGKNKAEKIMSELGEVQIEKALERYVKRYKISKLDKIKIADFGMKIFSSIGWGQASFKSFSFQKKTADIILKDNMLCLKYKELYKKLSKQPIDFFICGMIKKVCERWLEANMEVKEIKCLACGDLYCEFQAEPKS